MQQIAVDIVFNWLVIEIVTKNIKLYIHMYVYAYMFVVLYVYILIEKEGKS